MKHNTAKCTICLLKERNWRRIATIVRSTFLALFCCQNNSRINIFHVYVCTCCSWIAQSKIYGFATKHTYYNVYIDIMLVLQSYNKMCHLRYHYLIGCCIVYYLVKQASVWHIASLSDNLYKINYGLLKILAFSLHLWSSMYIIHSHVCQLLLSCECQILLCNLTNACWCVTDYAATWVAW